MGQEFEMKMLKTLMFTHGCMIQALIENHPNPGDLQRKFLSLTNALLQSVLEDTGDQEFEKMVRIHTHKILQSIPDKEGFL